MNRVGTKPLLAILGCVLVLALALCLPATALAATNDADISELTNRYSLLEDMNNAHNSDEELIVDTNISVLTSVNRALAGSVVRFSGEAIGEALMGDDADHMWVNVLGPSGEAIGVYMERADAEKIENFGSYQEDGATVEVEGIYQIACEDHEGGLDIHATSVKVVEAGAATEHAYDDDQLRQGGVMLAIGAVLLLVFVLLRRHFNKKAAKEKQWNNTSAR